MTTRWLLFVSFCTFTNLRYIQLTHRVSVINNHVNMYIETGIGVYSSSSASKPARTLGFKSFQSLPLFLSSYQLVTTSSNPAWKTKVAAKTVATKVAFLLKIKL